MNINDITSEALKTLNYKETITKEQYIQLISADYEIKIIQPLIEKLAELINKELLKNE